MSTTEPLLEMRDVSAAYGDAIVLKSISLTVPQSSIVSIVGVNGAGKTTTMKVMSGVIKPVSGVVRFRGETVVGRRTPELVQRGIAHCPEGRRVFPFMSVLDNLKVGAYTMRNGARIDDGIERAYRLFPQLDLRRRQLAGTLSGGEQQMLAIARALMTDPVLLLLDEPTLGLAPKIVTEVGELILKIKEEGTSIVLVEQNAEMALQLADYAYVLELGRILYEGEPEELRKSDVVRKAYLGM